MTKRKKNVQPASLANLRPAKKGEVRNPEGGRSHDPVKKALRLMTSKEFNECIQAAIECNLSELTRIIQNPKSTALKVGIATSLANAIKEGDWHTLRDIVANLIGKVPDKVDHTSDGKPIENVGPKVILYLPKNGKTKEENGL